MKILVTGSTGFVGRHLIPELLLSGHEVLEVTIEPDVSERIFGVSTTRYTLTDNQDGLIACVKDYSPEIIIHLASYLTSADDYLTLQKLLKVNVEFLSRILDCTKYIDLKLFINTGSSSEYLNGDHELEPAYLYSATKIAGRTILDYYSRIRDFKQTIAIPYTIYGGIDSQKKIIDILYNSLDNPASKDLSPGGQTLDFIHISDIVRYYLYMVEKWNDLPLNSKYHLGTGEGTTIQQLAQMLEAKTQKTANVNWGGILYRESDIMYSIATNVDSNIQWRPKVSLSEGLNMYIAQRETLR
jgi:nucleoside-diphosphate-sugar epimerase